MSQFIYDGRHRRPQPLLWFLLTANVGFALVVLGSWSWIGPLIADPASVTIGDGIGADATPRAFDYPFVILWAIPAGAAAVALLLLNVNRTGMAKAVAAYPILLIVAASWWHLQGQNVSAQAVFDSIPSISGALAWLTGTLQSLF